MYRNRFPRLHWTRAGVNLLDRMTQTEGCIIWSIHRWIRRGHPQPFRYFFVFLLYLHLCNLSYDSSLVGHSSDARSPHCRRSWVVVSSIYVWEFGARSEIASRLRETGGVSRLKAYFTHNPQATVLAALDASHHRRTLCLLTITISTQLTRINLGNACLLNANARELAHCSRRRSDWITALRDHPPRRDSSPCY